MFITREMANSQYVVKESGRYSNTNTKKKSRHKEVTGPYNNISIVVLENYSSIVLESVAGCLALNLEVGNRHLLIVTNGREALLNVDCRSCWWSCSCSRWVEDEIVVAIDPTTSGLTSKQIADSN